MTERQIHDGFNVWLRERQIPFVESRMDRKSTIAKAWPDYTILWMGHGLCIEVKTAKGKLRPDQVKCIEYIRRSGNRVEVCRSVSECVEACHSILCIDRSRTEAPMAPDWPLKQEFAQLKATVDAVGKDSGHKPAMPEPFVIVEALGQRYVAGRNLDGVLGTIRKASAEDVLRFPRAVAEN